MEQLTLGDILDIAKALTESGMTEEEMRNMPIYIGDDEELNGIHIAWYKDIIDSEDPNSEYYIELIEDSSHGTELNGKAILIS
jgi:hypothetical protein